ncbi:hypothetical protein [Wolbachia endosymbiont of Cantharis cryptica]|uniref:hypothetical protein n=1 Tax=Wolbachia endosymbiont of Cantharis cryptica TaxID=3066132 RepID=UPI00376F1FF3
MTTNWLHDLFFGSNESKIKALEELQNMDAEQFEKAFNVLKELQGAQNMDDERFKEAFNLLKELQGAQNMDDERFGIIQKYLDGLQERLADVEEQVGTLTETVADQERIMATCIIVTAIAAIVVASFVIFCIYQGVECERKKKEDLSKDTPDTKLNNLGTDEKLSGLDARRRCD